MTVVVEKDTRKVIGQVLAQDGETFKCLGRDGTFTINVNDPNYSFKTIGDN